MAELERIVRITKAYDCLVVQPCTHGSEECGNRPGAGHGRHNAELHMILRGERAEVVLSVSTGWHLPETPPTMRLGNVVEQVPHPICVEFHSADPQYEGHEPRGGSCPLWTPCYWNAGYGLADQPAELLVREGSDAVWSWLEAKHRNVFDALGVTGG